MTSHDRSPALTLVPLRESDLTDRSPVLAELTGLYAGNAAYHRLSGEFGPRPEAVPPGQVAAALREETAMPGAEVLLARPEPDGPLAGLAALLAEHPRDGHPWIGLLMVTAALHRTGYGRALAHAVEDRLRCRGRSTVRLAVLENNPAAAAFWTALGYREIDRRRDRQAGRPCVVLEKDL
ncbi:GNAT family N-acetyltransferase [Streptacidiphilus griseoplanus]|uniref:GNAT family N-acetyltransferase n=1 Tax=Peterkaempfera griseoplana TaxID=66896 RepID=UPI0006E19E21|nr:GNAT family N-acetyltransferase [Peterkaempfera griseoplana]